MTPYFIKVIASSATNVNPAMDAISRKKNRRCRQFIYPNQKLKNCTSAPIHFPCNQDHEQFHLLGAIRLRRYFSLTILMYHSTECTEYDKQALAAYKSFDDCRLFTDGLTR